MTEDFAATYRQMSDDELERVLGDSHDLLDEARSSLLAELRSRNRNEKEIALLAAAGQKRSMPLWATEGVDLQLTAQIGRPQRFGALGRAFLGKGNYTYNQEYAYEEFDATLYWTLYYIPVVARGRFRIRRRVQYELPFWVREKYGEFAIVRRLSG